MSNVYWHHGFSCQRTNCCCHPQFYLKGVRNRLYNIKKGDELGQVLSTVQKDYEGMQILWATLTTPACEADAVPSEMKNIVQGFRKLTSSREIKPHLIGSFRGIHIKYNPTQDTHMVHIHALLGMKATYQSRGYLTRDKWRKVWKEAVRIPSAEQVRVKRLEPELNNSLIALAVNKGIYAMKPMQKDDWTPTGLAAFYSYTKDKRLTAYTGKFKEARKSYIKPQFVCLCPECRKKEEAAKYA